MGKYNRCISCGRLIQSRGLPFCSVLCWRKRPTEFMERYSTVKDIQMESLIQDREMLKLFGHPDPEAYTQYWLNKFNIEGEIEDYEEPVEQAWEDICG